MNYCELKQIFRELKQNFPKEDLTAHIIFTEDSFDKKYPLLSRTYSFTSDNKAFWPNMGGYSIFGYCLDGTDQGVRLDWYMAEERDPNGWKVEDCYILEQMQNAEAIPSFTRTMRADETVCYFFGDTCIRVREIVKDRQISLEPVAGERAIMGEWAKLPIDRVYGYCTLLTRYLNEGARL